MQLGALPASGLTDLPWFGGTSGASSRIHPPCPARPPDFSRIPGGDRAAPTAMLAGASRMPLWIHVLLLVSSVAAAGGQLLLKQGAAGRIEALAFVNIWVFGGLALYGLSTILWVVAL